MDCVGQREQQKTMDDNLTDVRFVANYSLLRYTCDRTAFCDTWYRCEHAKVSNLLPRENAALKQSSFDFYRIDFLKKKLKNFWWCLNKYDSHQAMRLENLEMWHNWVLLNRSPDFISRNQKLDNHNFTPVWFVINCIVGVNSFGTGLSSIRSFSTFFSYVLHLRIFYTLKFGENSLRTHVNFEHARWRIVI